MAEKMAEKLQLEGITVKKEADFSEWYNQVVLKAGLADYSPVRGFMIFLPRGYALWEKIQRHFDFVLARHKVNNVYYPLVIPEKFFKKEAVHAKGFAPELAWIEKKDEDGERVAVRPTSETIMYDSFSKYIRSWRDLPLRFNQWCSVLRWEVKQTKLFLRTREFLWQEGHCVYENERDCASEALAFLNEYKKICEELLAIPVIIGEKTELERFAGAKQTFTVEALMPDGRALQMGTSHNLGQNFAKTFNVKYLDNAGAEQIAWQNSWGMSTRIIGAMVMVHSDDKGLVVPPKTAPAKVVIVPILFEDSKKTVLKKAAEISEKLIEFGAFVDAREHYTAGWKFNEWELVGIPVRIEIGPKDLKKKQVVLVRRDSGEKKFVKFSALKKEVSKTLEQMQKDLFLRAKKFLEKNTVEANSWQEFAALINERKFVLASFCERIDCEEKIREETTVTSRCIPFGQKETSAKCVKCGEPAKRKSFFAKAY